MTLSLFSFRHTSLLTVHTDLYGHTASGCLCGSRPLQWCLMYLSRRSRCPKSSQRDSPSSGISLFGTKSNQQMLKLANTEGGRAQSLFVGPKTAWRLSRCGRSIVMQKEPVTRFTHSRSNTSNSVYEPFHYTFAVHYIDSFTLRNKFFVDYALPIEENHQHGLHTRLLKSQFFRSWRGFSDSCSGLTFSDRIAGKTPADYFCSEKWNPTWREVSLTRFRTSKKPWQVH